MPRTLDEYEGAAFTAELQRELDEEPGMRSRESVRRRPVELYRVCLRCREENPTDAGHNSGVHGLCGGLIVRQPRRTVGNDETNGLHQAPAA